MAPGLTSLLSLAILLPSVLISAQNISTSPVPPLQWINLSGLLQGSTRPPPLKNAAMGYDETSRSIIIFGGVSASGIPQSQTYLLNLDTLSWSVPSPPNNLKRTPSARSEVVSGTDSAASNRRGFIVIGGKDVNGEALSDIWEFDFTNQFWSPVTLSPGGPSARWGAAGGIDPRVQPISDPVQPGPNNTFYLAGGFDGKKPSALSDVWELSLSGTLSSNLPDAVAGSWRAVKINVNGGTGVLPGRIELAGAVVGQQVVAAGGCDASTAQAGVSSACAQQDSFVISVESGSAVAPSFCPAPRAGPVLVPNQNTFSTGFAAQVFLLLGTLDSKLWDDAGGLVRGEVAVLDINAGTWTRVLPSGDPNFSGSQQFPSPREGAAAISFSKGLVGSSRTNLADTIVFGGQTSDGTFLSDLWLLRSYAGLVSPSTPNWSGFGNGQLTSGVDANGAGVSVQYLDTCASRIAAPPASSSSSVRPSSTKSASGTAAGPSNTGNPIPSSSPVALVHPHEFDTAFAHKLLPALSVVLLLPVVLVLRWSTDKVSLSHWQLPPLSVAVASIVGLAAYALGVAGFVVSFTTIRRADQDAATAGNLDVQERLVTRAAAAMTTTTKLHLRTAHGIVGLVFFLCLYVLLPLLYLAKIARALVRARTNDSSVSAGDATSQRTESGKSTSLEMDDKLEVRSEATSSRSAAAAAGYSVNGRRQSQRPPMHQRPQSMHASLLDMDAAGVVSGGGGTASSFPRARSMSLDAFTALRDKDRDKEKDKDEGEGEGAFSAEGSVATTPTPPPTNTKGGFEVLNRGANRTRKVSEPWAAVGVAVAVAVPGGTAGSLGHAPGSSTYAGQQPIPATRRLSEIDWLLRRRSLNAVGELDYAITQAHNAQYYANKNAEDAVHPAGPPVVFPARPTAILRHVLLQTSILGLCGLTLAALWTRAPRYLFALFLVWTLAYVLGLLLLAYHGRPTSPSILATAVWRLRGRHPAPSVEAPAYQSSPGAAAGAASPLSPAGPYRHHRPPVRPASTILDEQSHLHSPLSIGTDDNDDDDDMDEDTRQRLIEEEMERRDVSIITVPRRKLVLANPS